MAKKADKNLIIGLDVGTSKVAALVGEVAADNSIEVIGIGVQPSRGLKKGVVVNIESTVQSIQRAVEEAELMAGCEIRSVFAGRPALCAEVNAAIATSRLCGDVSAVDELSPREFEILRMILEAKSTDEIASAFNLSPKTVANYHYEIKSKLGVRSDIELVYLCMRQGLVEPLAAPGT